MTVRSRTGFVLVAVALLAGACGSDSAATDDSSGVTTTSSAASTAASTSTTIPTSVPLTATHRGVTADTITVGVALLDIDALVPDFMDAGWGDQELVWQAYFDDINERGGINGRTVEPIIRLYNPINTLGAEELCLVFTEDVEVFAVLGGFLGPAEAAMSCLAEREELVLIGGTMTDELLATAEAAWYITGRQTSRNIPAFLDLLDADGRLQGRAIAIASGDEQSQDTENILLPELEERGIEVVAEVTNVTVGTDIVAEDAFWDVAAEVIKESDADVIIVNGDTTSAIRGISRSGLPQEVWAVDAGQLASLGASVTKEEADGVITIQGLTADEIRADPLMMACADVFTEAHPEIEVKDPDEVSETDEEWVTSILQACINVPLFELLVSLAGPDLTPDAVRAAADGLGEFSLPGAPNASLGPGKPDAGDSARISVWDSTEGEDGGLVPLTDILDLTP